ncbi:hypothetical protein ACFSR7_25410 [Cohnella sp. GCM10020058]
MAISKDRNNRITGIAAFPSGQKLQKSVSPEPSARTDALFGIARTLITQI